MTTLVFPDHAATLVSNMNMEVRQPHSIPADSVAFLGAPGYQGEGFYDFGKYGIRLVSFAGKPGHLTTKAFINYDHSQDMTLETLEACNARLVVGIAQPFRKEFTLILRERFQGVGR